MKGRRKHRETGGVNEAEEDLKDKPEARTKATKEDEEAEERKHGGRAGSDSNPFTSARAGKDAPGRELMKGEVGFGET